MIQIDRAGTAVAPSRTRPDAAQPDSPPRPPSARRVAGWLLTMVAANSAIALLLSLLHATSASLAHNWVYSQAIGLSVCMSIIGPRWLLWPHRAPPILPMVAVAVAGTAAGFLLGDAAASGLLGLPRIATAAAGRPLSPALVTTLLATAAGTAWFWTRERVAALRLRSAHEHARAEAAQRAAVDAQLRMLRAQLEPHMLFNTLANLRALIDVDAVRAQAMLDRLISYLRATLEATRTERSTLAREFALLDDYLSLIAIRMGPRLHYALDLPAGLAGLAVPPMLLQPLVENAVRHGIEPAVGGGTIEVGAAREGDTLVLCVVDSGVGFSPAAHRASTGMLDNHRPHEDASGGFGLGQTIERLDALYGGAAGLSVVSPRPAAEGDPHGAAVTVRLPAQSCA